MVGKHGNRHGRLGAGVVESYILISAQAEREGEGGGERGRKTTEREKSWDGQLKENPQYKKDTELPGR